MTELSERLKQSRIQAGFSSVREAAESLGVKYPTYAGHENGSREFHRAEAEHYGRRFQVSAGWLLTGKNPTTSVGAVPVIGQVSAGDWLNVEDVENADAYDMDYIPATTEFPVDWQYAFTVKGNSINRVANEGDKLVCLDLIKSGIEVSHDDLIVAEQSKHDGQMLLRTAKRVRRTSQGFELWPESDDPKHQQPIIVNGPVSGVTTRIMAKVLWIMRKP